MCLFLGDLHRVARYAPKNQGGRRNHPDRNEVPTPRLSARPPLPPEEHITPDAAILTRSTEEGSFSVTPTRIDFTGGLSNQASEPVAVPGDESIAPVGETWEGGEDGRERPSPGEQAE